MKFTSIKRNSDFVRGYKRGFCHVSPLVIVYIRKNGLKTVRVGITSSKKTGNAVSRNRARRLVREALRSLNPDLNRGFDLIFVTRSRTAGSKSGDLAPHIRRAFDKAGVKYG